MIQDGLGDWPIADFHGKTPLEAARTPHMDELARRGLTGLMDIIAPGVTVGTDKGHLALFGQDADNHAYRRGPLEAVGAQFDLKPGQIALRFNFATVDAEGRILDRRAGRIREEAVALVEALNSIRLTPPSRFRFVHATEHRGVLILQGPGLSPEISDTDPGDLLSTRSVLRSEALDDSPASRRTALLVNRLVDASRQVLRDHPVNRRRHRQGLPGATGILTRGAGTRQSFIQLPEAIGLRIACVTGEATVGGLARLVGVDVFSSPAMTANLDTNLSDKAETVLNALDDHDLVYLHIKGADIAGHDRNPRLKREFIQRTDQVLGGLLAEADKGSLNVALVADHATPSDLGEHSGDPVPIVVVGPGIPPDGVVRYGESYCREGGLGQILSRSFLDDWFRQLQTGDAFAKRLRQAS